MSINIKRRLSKLGDKNPMWRGDDVTRSKLHEWIRRRLPKPELCPECNVKPPYDLANINGVYNRDFKNWKYMCRSCHSNFDYANGFRMIGKHYNQGPNNYRFGRTHSTETKMKISQANSGRKFSDDARRNISEGHKKWWAMHKAKKSTL